MRTIAVLLAAAAASAGAQEAGKKKVVCTLPALRSIAEALSEGDFEVTSLAHPEEDPHFVRPTPSLMKRLREADLFVENGLGLELWADEAANGAGNPKVARGGKGRITAAAGIPREEVPAVVARSEGDVHPEGNPHVWLDPLRARKIAENIAAGLKAAAPEKAAAVDARLRRFRERIDEAVFGAELVKEAGGDALARRALAGTLQAWLEEKKLADKAGGWLRKAAPLRGRKVVEFHKTWIYGAKLFGFEIVGSVEPKAGIKPGPRHLEELRKTMQAQGVGLILMESHQDASNPKALAEQTGAKVASLPTQPADGEDYLKFLERVLEGMLAPK